MSRVAAGVEDCTHMLQLVVCVRAYACGHARVHGAWGMIVRTKPVGKRVHRQQHPEELCSRKGRTFIFGDPSHFVMADTFWVSLIPMVDTSRMSWSMTGA